MKKHKQCRNPKEKISKLPKKQVVHRKKGQSSFEVQTNNGYKPWKYTKHGINHLDPSMHDGRHLGILF